MRRPSTAHYSEPGTELKECLDYCQTKHISSELLPGEAVLRYTVVCCGALSASGPLKCTFRVSEDEKMNPRRRVRPRLSLNLQGLAIRWKRYHSFSATPQQGNY